MKTTLIIAVLIIIAVVAALVLQQFTNIKPIDALKNLFQSQSLNTQKQAFPSAEKQLNIFIRDKKFLPNYSAIQKGTKVTWYNEDSLTHTVTGDSWDSGQILPSQTFSKVFDQPGDYKYHCSIHPGMTGEIIVQ